MQLRKLIVAACYGVALAQDSSSSTDVSSSESSSESSSGSSSTSSGDSSSTSSDESSSTSSEDSSSTSSGDSSTTDSTSSSESTSDSSSTDSSDSSSTSTKPSDSSSSDSSSTTSSSSSTSSRPKSSSSTTASRPKASSVTATFVVQVPNNKDNPFLESTHLPEGTLFIACGSILLGIFLAVGAWRMTEVYAQRKATQFTQEQYQELSGDNAKMHKVEADYDLTIPGTFQANSQMFFSPTVNVMQNGSIGPMVTNSNSNTYLPAGYYNAHRGIGDLTTNRSDSPSLNPPTMSADGTSSANSSQVYLGQQQQQNRPQQQQQQQQQRRRQRPPSEFLNDLLSH